MAYIQKPKKNRANEDRKKERQQIYDTKRWRDLRLLKLQLNPCCEICGGVENLHVHHIVSMFDGYYDPQTYDKLAYDINNLQTLCEKCHNDIHKKKGFN